MKKIAMFTMGTRGDVQPYIFLSKALIRNGYDVTLGSHPCWKELIEESGIPFKPIGPDIDIEKEAAIIRGKNSSPALSMLKTMNFVFRIIENSTHEIYKVCEGKDLIIVSHSQMGATEAEVMSKELNLIPISTYVLERNPYWEEKNILTGYWYEDNQEYVPSEELQKFLEAGDAPAILALGAMSFEDESEKEKLDMFVNAFRKTGCRVIIQGFQKTIQNYELPETMIACGSVPHSWLFDQGKFVVHHCGFGTSASTMIWGIPSIPIPHVLDQMGYAIQLYDNNVATKPLKSKDLSEQTIIGAIKEMNDTYEEKKKNALILSQKLKSEDGVAEAVRLIEKTIFL